MPSFGVGERESHFLDAEEASVPLTVAVTDESKFWHIVFVGSGSFIFSFLFLLSSYQIRSILWLGTVSQTCVISL